MSMTAASSPTFGPTTTRGSRSGCLSKIACSVSAPSLPIGRNCMPPSSIHRMPGAAAAGGPAAVVECVPNVSEGRDRARIDALASAIRAVPGVTLANVHADPDHHRSVITFLGTPDARSEEHTSELQSQSNLVCRLLLEKKKKHIQPTAQSRGAHTS